MGTPAIAASPGEFLASRDRRPGFLAVLAGGGALLGAGMLVQLFPALRIEMFARGAAELVGFFTGAPVSRSELGWVVPMSGAPVVVTPACSATDYFLIVASLIAFQAARLGTNGLPAATLGVGVAVPVAIFVNAVRIVTVAYAHPWFISRLPASYESFLHMTTGAAVFLPSLITLNLLFETYGRHRSPARA